MNRYKRESGDDFATQMYIIIPQGCKLISPTCLMWVNITAGEYDVSKYASVWQVGNIHIIIPGYTYAYIL